VTRSGGRVEKPSLDRSHRRGVALWRNSDTLLRLPTWRVVGRLHSSRGGGMLAFVSADVIGCVTVER
jgi:hypothetical protein